MRVGRMGSVMRVYAGALPLSHTESMECVCGWVDMGSVGLWVYVLLVYIFRCIGTRLRRDWHARALFIVPFLSRVLSRLLVLRLSFSFLSCARSRILSCVSVGRQAVCILSLSIACVYRLPGIRGIQHLSDL